MFKYLLTLSLVGVLLACSPEVQLQKDAESFLQSYSKKYQQLYYASARAEWKANT